MPAKTEPPALPIWSLPVSVVELPDAGLHREIEADADARGLVAAIAEVRDVSRLVARFDIAPMSGGRVHVRGHVSARIGQNCVVTLEPLDADIEEDVDIVFSPHVTEEEYAAAEKAALKSGEFELTPEGDDPPEPLVNGKIDLGLLTTEFMILGINPYPRKADAVYDPPAVTAAPEEHPFAALKALKDKPLKS
jgi:hypothetical protein